MGHLLFILISTFLLVGFVVLTEYEANRGVRLFATRRERLDEMVARLMYIISHIDFAAFMREEVARAIARVGHDIAHLSLRIVRAVERLLTRVVRYLRVRHSPREASKEQAREFVKTLSDFKENLKQKTSEDDIKD
jgi:hypothetical protein